MRLACRYDRNIIVEEEVLAREIEVAVLGNDHPKASLPGEIVPGADFYDYADKYEDGAKLLIPAPSTTTSSPNAGDWPSTPTGPCGWRVSPGSTSSTRTAVTAGAIGAGW